MKNILAKIMLIVALFTSLTFGASTFVSADDGSHDHEHGKCGQIHESSKSEDDDDECCANDFGVSSNDDKGDDDGSDDGDDEGNGCPTETTDPETTVPPTTVPPTTVPETTVPETTVPVTTVPETTVLPTTPPTVTGPTTTTTAPPVVTTTPVTDTSVLVDTPPTIGLNDIKLPVTGAGTNDLVWIGAFLLVSGAFLIAVRRKTT